MPTVQMPRLSDSMEEGVILAWLVTDGAVVRRGDPLVEIETDKATVVYQAPEAGTLRIGAQVGDTVAVGTPLATLEDDEPLGGARTRVVASPLARRVARDAGIDLTPVNGTGPRGRIVKRDVLPAVPRDAASPAPVEPSPSAPGTVEELSRVQALVARRMTEAHATVPDFALTVEVDMQAVSELRERLKAELVDRLVPSVNDFVIKAAALALRQVPRANGSYRDGHFEVPSRVNVGVAVASEDSLLVPTLFDADRLGLGEIARRSRELAARARSGELTPAELDGATFTVSNLGMFGITRFTAIVNPPQAAILAVAAVVERVVPHQGAPAIRPRMDLTLSSDHRILYGADAAQFLIAVRENLERPMRLLL